MEVIRVSAYYQTLHGLNVVNMAAACPTGTPCDIWMDVVNITWSLSQRLLRLTGGVLFINDVISWHVPRLMTPLVDDSFEVLELHMGINGKRLDRSQMVTQGYTLSTTHQHIVIEIPVGSPDGHFKVGKSLRTEMWSSLVCLACLIKCYE